MLKKNWRIYGIAIFLFASLLYYFFIDIVFFLGMQNFIQYHLSSYQGKTLCLAFSGDSKFLASGGKSSNFKNIQVWSTSDKKLVKTFQEKNDVYSILISRDAKKIITDQIGYVMIYDNKFTCYLGNAKIIKGISLSNDEKLLAVGTGCQMNYIEIFFMDSKRKYNTRFYNQITYGHTPQFICQDKILLCHHGEEELVFRDSQTWRELKRIEFPLKNIRLSEDGKFALGEAWWKNSKKIELWSVEKNKKFKDFDGYLSCFSADSKFVALVHTDHTIVIYSIQTGEVIKKFLGHSGQVYAMCFSPNGKWLASSGIDNKIQLWNTNLPLDNKGQLNTIKNNDEGINNNDYCEENFSEITTIKRNKESVSYFIQALKSSDEYIRISAASALAQIGPDAKDAIPELTQTLQDKDCNVLFMTFKALKNIGILNAEILLALIRLEKYDSSMWLFITPSETRIYLCEKNKKILPQIIKEIKPALIQILNSNNDPYVRSCAYSYLQIIKSKD